APSRASRDSNAAADSHVVSRSARAPRAPRRDAPAAVGRAVGTRRDGDTSNDRRVEPLRVPARDDTAGVCDARRFRDAATAAGVRGVATPDESWRRTPSSAGAAIAALRAAGRTRASAPTVSFD